jgi:RNA polymerase sigma-70 factor (ECF subfamily)
MLDRQTLQRLFRYGYALTRDEDAAYDLLQDALEASLRKAPEHRDSAFQYVRSIMRHRFIDQYRRELRHPSVSFDANDDQPVNIDPHALEDIVMAERRIEDVMAVLDPLERELLFFWAAEGCTAQEIADRTDSPRGTVLSRIHRLRQKLLRLLGNPDSAAGGDSS